MSISLAEPLLALLAIMAIGWWLGQQQIKGIALGSAGVFFVALVFGHFGMSVPREVRDLGLLLFVYAVGLQAGPRFFRTLKRQGWQFVFVSVATVAAGALATVAAAYLLRLPYDLAAGLFTGALTNTPALAAATDVVERLAPGQSGNVSAGYGIAYPYSMLSVVLLVQVLPRLLGRRLRDEEAEWERRQREETPGLTVKKFRLTNPNCFGKTISAVNPHRMLQANISRIRRGERVFAATTDVVLEAGDIVMVVGSADELDKMGFVLGQEVDAPMDINTTVASLDVEMTEQSLAGQTLAQARVWERYGVVITRLRREGLEIAPKGNVALEIGDSLRVVGEREAVDRFVGLVHGSGHRADETNMVPFLAGLVLGILAGNVGLHLGGNLDMKLGTAGGVFIVSLLVGHVGRIGRFRLYVPAAARNLSRELGLALFLAGAGTDAGARLLPIIRERGWSLLLAGACITTVAVLAGLCLMVVWFGKRMNSFEIMGALCAAMTNPPALSAASGQTTTGVPAFAYASVYPVALILKILLAQVLVEVLRLL